MAPSIIEPLPATTSTPSDPAKLRALITSQAVSPAHEARLLARHNLIDNTAGLAPGFLQANFIALPSKYAADFRALCARNPIPCPILGITSPVGDIARVTPSRCITTPDFDIRTDFPAYKVFQNGAHVASPRDIRAEWTPDHVGFLIGCSYSFEDALTRAGLQPRHQAQGICCAMYRTNIPVHAAGVFTGATWIVSMRPYRAEDVERVRDITRPYLATHGEPVAWGWEGARRIGVRDVHEPDFGCRQTFEEGEVPVFWGCGVTPQMVVEAAGDKIEGTVMAHEPGHMLITDWTVEDLPALAEKY